MPQQTQDLLQKLDSVPPFLCRILAHDGRWPINETEMVRRTKFCVRKIRYLTAMTSWATVSVADIVQFSAACDVDLDYPAKAKIRLRRMIKNRFRHLRPRLLRVLMHKLSSLPKEHPARVAWGRS